MDVYSRAFVDALPPPPGARPLLARLAARYRARDPVQLAARGHHRPLRGGGGLDAVARRDRRVAAGRHDQAPPGDLRGGARRRSAIRSRRRSCTSATTGRRTWSGRERAGWRAAYYLATGRATRRSRAAPGTTTVDPHLAPDLELGTSTTLERRPRAACVGRLAADGAPRPPRQPRAARRGRRGVGPRRHPGHDARPVPGPDGRLRRRPADRARRRRDRDPAVLADRVRPSPPDRLPGRLVPGDAPRRLGRPVRRRASSCSGWSTRSSPPSSLFLAAIFVVAELTLSAERS